MGKISYIHADFYQLKAGQMPPPNTEMQKNFAIAYANNGGDHVQAALDAGYSETSARQISCRMLRMPHVNEMIMAALCNQKPRAGAIGLKALEHVAQSETAPAAARVAAGRALIEFAGLASKEYDEGRLRRGEAAPDYKSILDRFATISVRTITTQ